MGVGGQHALQVDQTGRRAFRRHPPADGRRVAARIKADATPRAQFHHVIDIVPTIYEQLKITPPRVVNGFEQDPIHGVSMGYTLADAKAAGRRKTQFFDIMASRGIYHDGWFASAPGPREPWVGGMPKGIKEWSPLTDKWELYNIDKDWSQANDLAGCESAKTRGDEGPLPARIREEQEPSDRRRLVVHGAVPSGGRPRLVLTEWTFDGPMTRMPESAAPKLGKVDSTVSMDLDVPANANGVLYALAGFSGGVTCYVKDGVPELRVQPVRDRAHQDQGQGQAADGQGENRGRIEAGRPRSAGR